MFPKYNKFPFSVSEIPNNLHLTDLLDIVAEPANKRTLTVTMEFLAIKENEKFRSERSSIQTLDEYTNDVPITFPMSSFHPMIEEFNEKILRQNERGEGYLRNPRFNQNSEEIPALILSMDDLRIGFLACLLPLGISFVVFLVEIFVFKIQTLTVDFIFGSLTFYILKIFIKSY